MSETQLNLFDLIDRNGDGDISEEELKDFLAKYNLDFNDPSIKNNISRLIDVFDLIDQNGDGDISNGELVDFIIYNGLDPKDPLVGEKLIKLKRIKCNALFESIDRNCDGRITRGEFINFLTNNGLDPSDPRLAECMSRLDQLGEDQTTKQNVKQFLRIIRPNINLISRAAKGNLVIPDFKDFCEDLTQIFEDIRHNKGGHIADYIPELACVDEEKYALSVFTVNGQQFHLGDIEDKFTIQSTSKPINYCIALEENGLETVHKHIGREPSGLGFNELTLNSKGLPHNPMINAGAIMSCSLISPDQPLEERLNKVINTWQRLAGNGTVSLNEDVYRSESTTAHRNRALSHYMMEKNAFPANTDLETTLQFYFQCCSLQLSSRDMALVAATLANGGTCPLTEDKIFKTTTVQSCLSLMTTCGMYDYSGEWYFMIGLPAKSGVSGALMIIVPKVMGICIWSPRLDEIGNTVRGIEIAKELVNKFSVHTFDILDLRSHKKNPLVSSVEYESKEITTLIEVASRGDLNTLHHLVNLGIDVKKGDYDNRTAMHLASAEGQVKVVQYLIDAGANVNVKDRWGGTPMNDAIRNGKTSIIELLKQHGGEAGVDLVGNVKLLISNTVSSDLTGMIWAASIGNLDALTTYIARGVNLNHCDYDGRTALHLAASEGQVEIVRYLLGQKVDLMPCDRWNNTPADDALRHGHQEIVDLISSQSE
jgi:glutaminase